MRFKIDDTKIDGLEHVESIYTFPRNPFKMWRLLTYINMSLITKIKLCLTSCFKNIEIKIMDKEGKK